MIKKTTKESYFQKDKTHAEIIAVFEKDLAQWAIDEYKNKTNAHKVLDISLSKLNKDLALDRLSRKSPL